MTPRPVIALLLLLTPLLLAASDPSGDVGRCRPGAGGSAGTSGGVDLAPDLVSATGTIVELGTSALWTLRFADDLRVPDDRGNPFRVDLVLRDPSVPAVSFAYYRGLNRLVRYDAVTDPTLTILLIPERGQNVFMPPTVQDDTMTIQVPGRILTADEDETGTSPGLEHLRWGVIVRDGRTCDLLGAGRPTERFEIGDASSPMPAGSAHPEAAASGEGWPAPRYAAVGVLVICGILAFALLVRGRVRRRASG